MNQSGEIMDEGDLPYDQFIEILEEYREKCENEGNYIEAEGAAKRVEELKIQSKLRKKEDLKTNHLQERADLEENHAAEFNDLSIKWDEKMNQQLANIEEMEQRMNQKQKNEIEEQKENYERNTPTEPKASPELLNLRQRQKLLAKQRKYADAHTLQEDANKLEIKEFDKYREKREEKLDVLMSTLRKKQKIEKEALKKRCESIIQEQRIQRGKDVAKLLKKYENLKKDLENQQALEHNNLGKKKIEVPYMPSKRLTPSKLPREIEPGTKERGFTVKEGPPSIPSVQGHPDQEGIEDEEIPEPGGDDDDEDDQEEEESMVDQFIKLLNL